MSVHWQPQPNHRALHRWHTSNVTCSKPHIVSVTPVTPNDRDNLHNSYAVNSVWPVAPNEPHAMIVGSYTIMNYIQPLPSKYARICWTKNGCILKLVKVVINNYYHWNHHIYVTGLSPVARRACFITNDVPTVSWVVAQQFTSIVVSLFLISPNRSKYCKFKINNTRI